MLWYNYSMKCKFCGFEDTTPPKEGKDRNGIQRYRCKNCHRVFTDPIEYQEWEKRRKRAPNKNYDVNEYDECVTYLICRVLKKYDLNKLNGIGSSYSIAALLERAPSTIQLWLRKYKNTDNEPNMKMTDSQLKEYGKSKKFGLSICLIIMRGLFPRKKSSKHK